MRTMSLVQQVSLLTAGCQPWNKDVCAASGDRFAYCATLAVYIYKLDAQFNEFKLWRIMSEHNKTITSISWHPRLSHVIATSGADGQVIVWNMDDQVCMARLKNRNPVFTSIAWCYHDYDSLGLITGRGPLYTWNALYNPTAEPQSYSKDSQMLTFDVCQFRWHPRKVGKVVLGHSDGSISIFAQGQRPQRHVFKPDSPDDSDDSDDPVTDLQWDPLSTEYLLVANTDAGIRLLDTESGSVIMAFQLPSVATEARTLAWIDSAPGMFLTGDASSGVLRVWTVSKATPLESLKLKQTGFQSLFAFNSHLVDDDVTEQETGALSSTSVSRGPASQSRHSLPPCNVLCTFSDGGVGLYNLRKRKWEFLRDLGHVETIFDCKYKPDDYSQLATASFDGTIKIWDTETMTAVHTSPGNEGVIYSISWAPADLHCIAASTIRQGAFIWDVNKGRIIQRFTKHGNGAVYCISWCEKDSQRIATCGADGYCIVQRVDGAVLHKYLHPSPVFGCDWSQHNKDMLATTCEDKIVRVFYLTSNNDTPLKTFSGHTAKVFQVKWSPLRESLLCSGSDDGTVRVWDYTTGTCVHILEGHTGPVRGLLWNPEIPYLLLSGSWDHSIRVWDIRDGACLDTILDHGADVYGLACHPQRPFVVASCSRDSTVRLWSFYQLLQPLGVHALIGRPWSEITGSVEQAFESGVLPLLSGSVSRTKKLSLDRMGDADIKTRIRWFSQFFSAPIGADNLWELVLVAQKVGEGLLSRKYRKGILHMKHVAKFRASEAQEYELLRTKHQRRPGAPRVEDCLQKAADLHISLGNVQRYCELMVELGQWEKALALAPGVSMIYWKSLMKRRVTSLRQESSPDVLAYCMAIGEYGDAVSYMTSQGQYQVASTVAQVVHDSDLSPPCTDLQTVNSTDTSSKETSELVAETTKQSADWYIFNGQPVRAACCYLAVDRYEDCVSALIRGNELELAVALCLVLDMEGEVKESAVDYLSRRCEKIGMSHLAVDVLKLLPNARDAVLRLCARFSAGRAEINDLYEKAGLPSMEDCAELLLDAQASHQTMKIIRYGLLSADPVAAMTTGLRELKDRMSQPDWTVDDVSQLIQLLACYRIQEKLLEHGYDLLLAASYVGALMAIRRRYDVIVLPLFNNARHLLQKEESKLPISAQLLDGEVEAWRECQTSPLDKRSKHSKTFTQILRKCGQEYQRHLSGGDFTTGSHLPSHSDVHLSVLTRVRIQGPAYFLEDGKSAVGMNEALMWAKVNPFSPLNTGARLNPF